MHSSTSGSPVPAARWREISRRSAPSPPHLHEHRPTRAPSTRRSSPVVRRIEVLQVRRRSRPASNSLLNRYCAIDPPCCAPTHVAGNRVAQHDGAGRGRRRGRRQQLLHCGHGADQPRAAAGRPAAPRSSRDFLQGAGPCPAGQAQQALPSAGEASALSQPRPRRRRMRSGSPRPGRVAPVRWRRAGHGAPVRTARALGQRQLAAEVGSSTLMRWV